MNDIRRRELHDALMALRKQPEPVPFHVAARRPLLAALAVTVVYCAINALAVGEALWRTPDQYAPMLIVMGIVAAASHLGALIGALLICDHAED